MSRYAFPAEIEGWNVVLRGHFNPAIFQPMWFVRHGLLSEPEAVEAKIKIIQPEVSSFSVGSITLLITLDKFQAAVATAEFAESLRDLVLGTFDVLHETPLGQLGINRDFHFRMPSVEQWHTVGHKLAPKELWAGLMEDLGTRAVVMQGKRTGAKSEYTRITIEPSGRIEPGVYVSSNEHFDKPKAENNRWLLEALKTEWAAAEANAKHIGHELINRCLQ
jgi:hypothetical protein